MIDFSSEFGQRVKQRLAEAYFVWFTTTGADLTPQPRPVWFVWEGESFLIFSQPGAHKVAHIRQRPNVALHFNTTDEGGDENVIVFTGSAELDPGAPPAHEVLTYFEKYAEGIAALGMTPGEFSREYSLAIRVRPEKMRGW
jgi:PPOX class probable F420-dependent enzyme